MRRPFAFLGAACLLAWGLPVPAAAGKSLTLAQALAAADAPHPDLELAQADRDLALADKELAASGQDLRVILEGGLRRVRPSLSDPGRGGYIDDNSLRLSARKNLYDFGRTAYLEGAARSVLEARDAELLDVKAQRRIEIMRRFFDVLVADAQYAVDNEYMAVAYVNFDHARDRYQVGQISQVELAQLEARYQNLLERRNAAQKEQRITRALLANALGEPGKLPEDLEEPKLAGIGRPLPEYPALVAAMLEHNSRLAAARKLLAASRQRLEALRAEYRPRLDAELEAANYTRELSGRDDVRAGITLTVPLYQGTRVSARLAQEQARFKRLQAETDKLKMDLTQSLLETLLRIEQLQKTGLPAAQKNIQYRDLALEKARGEYEVELKTDLGDSMAASLEARLKRRKTEYQIALELARLEALLGEPLDRIAPGKSGSSNSQQGRRP